MNEELEIQSLPEEEHMGERFSTPIEASLALESSGEGGFRILGLGVRESSGERVRELRQVSELMRER